MAHIPTSETVAAEVRAHLARRRRTARELAEVLGVSEGTAYRRLSGESHWEIEEIGRIADWLDVPFVDLLGRDVA